MILALRALGGIFYVVTPFTFVWGFANLIREMVKQEIDPIHKENTKAKIIYGAIAGFSLLICFVTDYQSNRWIL